MTWTASDRRLLAAAAVFVVSQANIARVLGPAAPAVGRIQAAFSAATYRNVLDGLDADTAPRYRRHYYWDLVHPLIFAIALQAGARSLAEHRPVPAHTRRVLAVAPAVAAAADYVENAAGLYLLDHRDRITDTTVRVATTVSTVKWVLALGSLAYLSQGFLGLGTRAGLRRLGR
ncbi:hypothetical protein RAJCM14343_1379 [Rhodococcus aetherivorans]|uniref:Uncharacterized protein n=1 Tax=Rhodococcus aetherivorans TaxID=191292 RepID=A0ABQ0YHV2_9NOCA|nr:MULTISPECIES: hypothetical protein [Rhodococcus]ETT23839.1 hypothetical protein RR21198_5242 [Rhodococcus rhodochrous ATCC 21198]KDE12767.1 hypothetical protein N505_0115115 [Rhodococcus aetherivorans]MDV6296583.1 hypothetical protein [Rhodococcus aetherivorans]NGP28991.1 hypothetical protein [Rhodococcus aetherivorans]PND53769.1 hypothetical protein CQZ88_01405 [Rhodococcus sp. ENV425]